MTTTTVKLWDHPLSSFAMKVRIALRYKGILFEAVHPRGAGAGFLDKVDPDFKAANPRVEVPTLVDGDVQVFDSTIILEYIEDKWPEPALLPPRSAPAARARARTIEEICDTHYEAINWGVGEIVAAKRAEGDEACRMVAQGKHQIDQIHAWLTKQLGTAPYFGGDSFGWADASVAPYVNRSVTYGIAPAAGSPLARWWERVKQHPAVAPTLEEAVKAVPPPGKMAEVLQQGLMRREYRDHRLEWIVKNGGLDIIRTGLEKNTIRFPWPDPF